MCGIVGVVYRDPSRPAPPELLRRMCSHIRHRGPDDEGIHTDGSAGLGARRLSIIDLASGHQPMVSADGATSIAFNGEIYNYRALKQELAGKGHRFRTDCDTEVVLQLCQETGGRAPTRLRGMFAFAVWDARSRELLLARDRFGIKPLYYVAGPWGIAFASELRTLVRCGFSARELDWDALDMYLELGYVAAPATPFTDIRKLLPGHTLKWRDGKIHLEQYWDLPRPQRDYHMTPDAVRAAIDDSVKSHLVSDVPVAAFLSGGLDSSSVVASMAAQSAPPRAFVARFHGSGARHVDETGLAATLAEHCGVPLSYIDVRPDVAAVFDKIIDALDEPIADDSAIPTWFVAESVAREYKVALTGIGGDELFAGYARHKGILASELYQHVPGPVRGMLSRGAHLIRERADGGGNLRRVKRFLASAQGGIGDRFLSFVSRIPDRERARLYANGTHATGATSQALHAFRAYAESAGTQDPLATALYVDYKSFLADDVLALADRISMAHGLELRVPLVDHELVDAVFPVDSRDKISYGRSKQLLRRAMRERLPAALFSAPKRGFVGPTAAWLRNELLPLVRDELSPARVRHVGHFDEMAVTGLLDDHLSRRRDREGILWALLTFMAWHRIVAEPAPALASVA